MKRSGRVEITPFARRRLLHSLLLALSAALLFGCTYRPITGTARPPESRTIRETLYRQLEEWRSVRYRYGGLSKRGVDCSGFVLLTFRDKFGIDLPRQTKLQARKGKKVARRRLRAGDLVFFKTGFFSRHVGIYVESRKFLHASTGKGVTISSLDDRYWSRKYWQGRRIIN